MLQESLAALRAPTGRVVVRTPDPEWAVSLLDGSLRGRDGDRLWISAPDAAALNARLVGHGIRVSEIAEERRSLEDVVLAATSAGSDRVDPPAGPGAAEVLDSRPAAAPLPRRTPAGAPESWAPPTGSPVAFGPAPGRPAAGPGTAGADDPAPGPPAARPRTAGADDPASGPTAARPGTAGADDPGSGPTTARPGTAGADDPARDGDRSQREGAP